MPKTLNGWLMLPSLNFPSLSPSGDAAALPLFSRAPKALGVRPPLQPRAMEFDITLPVLSIRSKHGLTELMDSIFVEEGSARELGIDSGVLRAFIKRVGKHYYPNPYHNFHHAVDACNTMGWLLTRPEFEKNLSPFNRFLLLVSTLVHDLEHPGNDNQWEIKSGSKLAVRYHNLSVLENHSVTVTRELLDDKRLDIFSNLDKETRRAATDTITEYVLATDFARHQDFLDRLGNAINGGELDYSDAEFLSLICGSLIKAADIANTAKPYHLARPWAIRVMREFWTQGEREKYLRVEVGPLNDPETINVNAAQAGFIKFACLELFELLSRIEVEISDLVETLKDNIIRYERFAVRSS